MIPMLSELAAQKDITMLAQDAKAWPFEEARKILKRLNGQMPEKGYVLFETGYGPSGLPHIGTFGEVARTSMVRHAFSILAPNIKTRLFCFSDDMDGLRKVPDNVPNKEMLAEHLGKPLTQVPDPFGTHPSFGAHNNARLCAFLDSFGFEYEFQSSTEWYQSGRFDAALLRVLERYDAVMAVMLPTLGEERRASYSPFLPISPVSGKVLQVPVLERNLASGTIVFEDEDGRRCEIPVTGGHCKLQWKPDWAMRWHALQVDYEMSGKDLIDSVTQSGKIARALGSTPPESLTYELFLDASGQKISKSKGNGLTIEEWLRYAPHESLAYYMYQKPKTAKRLHFDVIPKAVDEYADFARKLSGLEPAAMLESPAWHVHAGHPVSVKTPLSFSLLLNLAGAANADSKESLWAYISRYAPGTTPENSPFLDRLAECAVHYYHDFVKPAKQFRSPTPTEAKALSDLVAALEILPPDADGDVIQTAVFEIGKQHGYENLRDWFQALYEILLGQTQGPRMGGFFALYGLENSRALIIAALSSE